MSIQKITVLAFGGLVLAGCMSLEERLASSDIEVRNEAEYELMAKVNGAPTSERLAAIRRVKNPEHLEYLAIYADESTKDDGLAAVDNIEDNPVLIRVAKKARLIDVRKAASFKIQDEKILCDIACGKYGCKGAAGDTFCMDALSRIKDKTFISKVAEEGKSDVTAKSAFQRLDEDEKLRIALMGGRQEYLQDVIAAGRTTKEVMDIVFSKGDSNTRMRFINACNNEDLLMSMVDTVGIKLSSDECAALAGRQNMAKLRLAVSVIADKRIAEELMGLIEENIKSKKDLPDCLCKDVKEKFSKISNHKVRMDLLMRGLQLDRGGYDIVPIGSALVSCINVDEAREIYPSISSKTTQPWSAIVYDFVYALSAETFARLAEIDSADGKLDDAMACRNRKRGEIDADALVRKRVNFKDWGFYKQVAKNETADYVWQNATMKGMDAKQTLYLGCLWKVLTPDQRQGYQKLALMTANKMRSTTPVFCGLYIGMPARDCIGVLSPSEKEFVGDMFETSERTIEDWKSDRLISKIKFDRVKRYKLFPKEDKEFWPAFLKEFMPRDANKKESAAEIVGGALDAAFGNYERERNKELDEMCYVLKSMKYGVRVSFGLESGTLIIEEYDGR